MIARLLLLRSQLPTSVWGHAILHVASIVRIRSYAFHKYSPLKLIFCQQPNISHSHFSATTSKVRPRHCFKIFIEFDSLSI